MVAITVLAVQLICRRSSSSTKHAAVFGGEQVGAASRGQADFQAAAAGFSRNLRDGIIFADFAVFQLCHPDLLQAFGGQQVCVFFTENVTFGQKLATSGTKDGTAQNPACGFANVHILRFQTILLMERFSVPRLPKHRHLERPHPGAISKTLQLFSGREYGLISGSFVEI
jgi:hypothetical protein